jgi:hypothetical protein
MTTLQVLLDTEAALSNARRKVLEEIKVLRGNEPPPCHGEDDCSTACLIVCPWRIDCGGES